MDKSKWSKEDIEWYDSQRKKQLRNKPAKIKVLTCAKDEPVPKIIYSDDCPPLYKKYRKRAGLKNLSFELSLEQFEEILSNNCSYCGDKATTIDRIDSSKGYTIDNSAPSCVKCNMMKFTMTIDDFLSHAKRITCFNQNIDHFVTHS